jgi:hypothetical protein
MVQPCAWNNQITKQTNSDKKNLTVYKCSIQVLLKMYVSKEFYRYASLINSIVSNYMNNEHMEYSILL